VEVRKPKRKEEKMKLAKLALVAASAGAAAVITAGCSSAPNPYVAGRDQCGTTTTTSVVDGKTVTTSTPRYCAIMSDGDQVLLNYLLWQNLMYGSTLQQRGSTYVYIAPSNATPAPVSTYTEDDTPVSESSEESEEDDGTTWDDGGSEYGDADPNYDSESSNSSGDDGTSDTDESGDNSDRYSDSDSDSDSDSNYSDSDESDDDG
jgi:hypothetical protein